MTDKEVLERLKRMYIEESAKLRRAKLDKEKAAARRAVEVLGEVIDWIMSDYTFRDMSGKPHDCIDCKHNDKQWYEMPCDACCPAHCGFEKKEKDHEP